MSAVLIWASRNKLAALLLLVLAVVAVTWPIDRARRYAAGEVDGKAAVYAMLAEQAAKQAATAHAASRDYQTARAAAEQKEQVRYVEVQKIIDRPVYRDGACFDASGLSVINAAIADGD